MKHKYFHQISGLLMLLVVILGITPNTTFSQDAISTYQEAPMLAARVANGDLPPVHERLPQTPLIVAPFDKIGTYGGELRYAGSFADVTTFLAWEFLMRWDADMSGVYANILESYEVNEDASLYTLHLRRGMRWSDGAPFTADDIVFAINDIYLNPELNPVIPANLLVNGEPPIVEKSDDYTVTFQFAGSYGLFPEFLAWWPSWQPIFFPKHWLSQYHIDYDPENVEAILDNQGDYPELAGANLQSWQGLFNFYALTSVWSFVQFPSQVNRPTLYAWVVKEVDPEAGTLTMERNPYYWKVDSAGNQLPYIDTVVLTNFAQNDDIKLLRLLSGEFDTTKDAPQEDYTLFLDSQDSSGLRVYDVPSDGANAASIIFNMNFVNDQKAAIYSNRDFRIGVSHAINRQQIMVLVYGDMGIPRQLAPLPNSPLYNEQLETQYTEFNIGLANDYLDRVLPEKDSEGYRLMPDGNRLVVNFQIVDSFGLGFLQITELIMQQLNAVGISATMEVTDSVVGLTNNNQLEATISTGEGGSGISAILDPRWFVPVGDPSYYATGWSHWYRNPNNDFAIVPPAHIVAQIELYEQVLSTPNPDERIRLMQEVLQISADEFYVIGIALPPTRYWLINERINNLPDLWFDGWIPGMQSITSPFQWFFDEG
jgi:peptide/nickel transport system substrate-binding protein